MFFSFDSWGLLDRERGEKTNGGFRKLKSKEECMILGRDNECNDILEG
jgi:hypothetical protein